MIIKNAYVYTLEKGFVKKDTVIENGYFSEKDRPPKEGETVIDRAEAPSVTYPDFIRDFQNIGADFTVL